MVITEVAMLVAAKNLLCPKLPIRPVSTIPTKGMARFEKKTGMDNKKICFLELFDEEILLIIFFFKVDLSNYIHEFIQC